MLIFVLVIICGLTFSVWASGAPISAATWELNLAQQGQIFHNKDLSCALLLRFIKLDLKFGQKIKWFYNDRLREVLWMWPQAHIDANMPSFFENIFHPIILIVGIFDIQTNVCMLPWGGLSWSYQRGQPPCTPSRHQPSSPSALPRPKEDKNYPTFALISIAFIIIIIYAKHKNPKATYLGLDLDSISLCLSFQSLHLSFSFSLQYNLENKQGEVLQIIWSVELCKFAQFFGVSTFLAWASAIFSSRYFSASAGFLTFKLSHFHIAAVILI